MGQNAKRSAIREIYSRTGKTVTKESFMNTQEQQPKKQNELVLYFIFGALTTVVSLGSYAICNSVFEFHYLISNVISWVLAVAFAYVTNKVFVFQSRGLGFDQLRREISLFVAARVASLGIEEVGLFVLIGLMDWNKNLSKLLMQVIVVIVNYVFSKLVIFRKPTRE